MDDTEYNFALAENFIGNALDVQASEKCWIEYCGEAGTELAQACAAAVVARGGEPYMVDRSSKDKFAQIIKEMNEKTPARFSDDMLEKMKEMQAYIRICDDADEARIEITPTQMSVYNDARKPARDYRVSNLKWLVVDAPTREAAEKCRMSYDEYRAYYLKVCTANHSAMDEPVKPLQKRLTIGRAVRIYNPDNGTDFTVTLGGFEAIPCTGKCNLPDGECFTAPELYSANGVIQFGPSVYEGQAFKSIRLWFENGRVMEAEAETPERTEMLKSFLDRDEREGAVGWGGRYIGEFSFDFNPYIDRLIGSILFDEKVNDGIHMALGSCYDEADNGNSASRIHWDMVHRGGQIYIDGELVRENGIFMPPDLHGLNTENLKAAMERRVLNLPKPPAAARQRQP